MNRIARRVVFLVGLGALAPSSGADPWIVAWEGNNFPELEGWERDLWGPEPRRTLENGTMTLDTRKTIELWDTYKLYRPLNPAPGDAYFFVTFRVRVDSVTGHYDPGVWLKTDNHRTIMMALALDHVEINNFITIAQFEPYVFHVFEFRSSDMETFSFWLDGSLAYEGSLFPSGYASTIGWGDIVYGASSLAVWDYLRLGTVPESGGGVTALVLAWAASLRRMGDRRGRPERLRRSW